MSFRLSSLRWLFVFLGSLLGPPIISEDVSGSSGFFLIGGESPFFCPPPHSPLNQNMGILGCHGASTVFLSLFGFVWMDQAAGVP